MSFTTYELLIRYAKDYKGKDITVADLRSEPWWKCVWGGWRAQAYYKINGFYERIEDVPEGLDNYWIMTDAVLTQHFNRYGKWETQKIDKASCKTIYGNII